MKKYLKIIRTFLMVLSVLFLYQCKEDLNGTDFKPFEGEPIGLYLESHDDFSMWVDILTRTGFYNTLNLEGTYTCFVPNNNAVGEFLNGKSLDEFEVDYLKLLVQFHSVGVIANSVDFKEGALADTTFSGDNLTISFGDGGFNNIMVNKTARIIQRDINSSQNISNGVIHVLDKVLIPITETVFDKLESAAEFSIFTEAVEAVGLKEELSSLQKSIDGYTVKTKFTVMAVPDAVFNDNNITSFSDLKERYSPDSDDITSSDNGLYRYVAYHVLKGAWFYNNLGTFAEGTNKQVILTLAPSELMIVEELNGELIVNKDDALSTEVRIDQDYFNINAKNGTLHKVDHMMPVYNPPPVLLEWSPTEIVECQELEIYGYKGTQTHNFSGNSISRWKWNIVDGYIQYKTKNNTKLRNYDWLQCEIRGRGWFEITTPMVLKGKYKLTIYAFGCNGNLPSDYEVSYGETSFGVHDFQPGSCNVVFPLEMSSPLIVSNNQEVTLRFTMITKGIAKIDYIKLEPIE